METSEGLIAGVAFLAFVALIGAYMVPAALAGHRHHPQRKAIAFVNVLLGWTVIGWLVALLWSVSGAAARPS